jgi:hypothetical protein
LFSGTTALNPRPKISPRRCKAETRIWAMEEESRAWVTDKDRQLETAAKEARQKFFGLREVLKRSCYFPRVLLH